MVVPKGAKLFDVEGLAVAELADGKCVAFGDGKSWPFPNAAKVFAYGSPVSAEAFAKLASK